MLLSAKEFFKKYRISDEDFQDIDVEWTDLRAIYADHENKQSELLVTGNMIAEHLSQIKEVHSLKVRVKEPDHLIEKIIRKCIENPQRLINLNNYQEQITDLIGVRGLHLFKDDWSLIHASICRKWDLAEPPKANIRKGDDETIFKRYGCEIVEKEHGYRSVHYLVKSQPTKSVSIAEVQIRTIFEEGWCEIDHRMRYPYDLDNPLISHYLAVFNRLAGNADEMGTFIRFLKTGVEEYETRILNRDRELKKLTLELEELKESGRMNDAQKETIQNIISILEKPNPSFKMIEGEWTCFNCGLPITKLPFEPSTSRPITCRNCHAAQRASRPSFGEKRY